MGVKTDRLHFEQYQDMIARLYPELNQRSEDDGSSPQKHGKDHVLSRTVTFQVTDYCNLKCFPAGTKILMTDFTYKNIEDVTVGDEVMSFDTKASKGKQITLSKTKVKYIFHRHDKVRKITTAQGATIYTTDEHPFLDDRKNWRRAETITPKTKLMVFNGIVEHDIPDIDNVDYRAGYVVGVWLGDGTMAYYKNGELKDAPTPNYQNRFVVKDIECTNQLEQFMRSIGIDITVKPFAFGEVSYPAIFAQGAVATEQLRNLIESNLATNTSTAYAKGFLAGLIDTEGNVGGVIRITNTSDRIINEVTRCADLLNIEWAKADTGTTPNYDHKWIVTLHGELLALLSTIRPAIPRKSLNGLLGKSIFSRVSVLDNELIDAEEVTVYNMETESHVYIANDFLVHNCSYCYQINKKTRMMSQETARKFVDLLLSGDKGFKDYVDPSFSPAIIIEFIGGEPFTNVDLIDYVCTYFYDRAIELHHPWAKRFMFSICSNGTLYFEPKVQKFLKKWKNNLSFSVTIDGDKELHDSCRVFPDGSGSYDLAVAAAKDWMSKGYYMGSKITIAPGNIDHVSHAIKHMVEMGYKEINCNCVYEKGWTQEHSTKLYYQLKDACQYLLDNNLEKDIFVSILEDSFFTPKLPSDTQTWCWGKGTPILTDKGYKPIEEIKIGDVVYTEQGNIKPVINTMHHFADNCVEIRASGVQPMVCTKDHHLFAEPYDYRGWKNTDHFKPYGKYEVQEIHNVKHPTKSRVRVAVLPSNRTVSVDASVAYLLGRTIGDGCWDDKNAEPRLCCGKHDLDNLKKCYDDAGIVYGCSEGASTYNFRPIKTQNVGNPNYDTYVRLAKDIGHLAHNKHIPAECWSWDNESLEALLMGFISADGYLKQKVGADYYNISTQSMTLINELMLIARTVGYRPVCDKPLRVDGKKEILLGREVTRHGDRWFANIPAEKYVSRYYSTDGDMLFTSRFTTRDVEPQEVYNITVADDHSYFAGSVVSGNCGGLGDMLSCDPDGYLYPCIRYMESSLGDERPPIRIGHVDTGICQCEEEKCTLCEICGVTRRTYNTDECFFCPIAGGCADCAAYNYQDSGTVYHRATYICEMHKARCLVNAYYWAMFYAKYEPNKKFVLRMPDEWSLKIIPKEELDMLKSLPNVVFMPETWEQVRDGFAAQGIYKEYMINEHKEKAFEEKD